VLAFTPQGFMEGSLDILGDRAGFAAADDPEIHFADGDALGCSAADEQFIGNIKLIA
jgi:uncharacterized protein YqfB (UPF0267 family)